MASSIPWLAALGIVLDIVGAAWIAKALAFSSTRDLMDQAATRWDISTSVLRSLEHQRLDSRCGLGVLGVGFAMQLGALFFPLAPAWVAAMIAVLTVATAGVYYRHTLANEDATRAHRVSERILESGRIP